MDAHVYVCMFVCVHVMQCLSIIFGAFTVLMIRIESCQDIDFSIGGVDNNSHTMAGWPVKMNKPKKLL